MALYRVTVQTTVQMEMTLWAEDADTAAQDARRLADDATLEVTLPGGMDWCGEWDLCDDVVPVGDSSEAGGA